MNDPVFILISVGIAGYIFYLWWSDYKAHVAGQPKENAFPGAVPAPRWWICVAAIGALVLVSIETGLEYAFDVSSEQSDITWLYLLAMLSAGFIEEFFFRGFLVVQNKGRAALIGSIVGFSLLFALLHVQYYTEVPEGASWTDFSFAFDTQAVITLTILFVNSLWFYFARFSPANPQRSLLPCIAAHVATNAGVFVIKLVQGHVTSLY